MNMPTRIGELKHPVARDEYEAAVLQMADNAMEDRCLPGNPLSITKETFAALFKSLY